MIALRYVTKVKNYKRAEALACIAAKRQGFGAVEVDRCVPFRKGKFLSVHLRAEHAKPEGQVAVLRDDGVDWLSGNSFEFAQKLLKRQQPK